MSELTKTDLGFLQEAAKEDGGIDNGIAARELALEKGGTGNSTEIRVKDESTGEIQRIEVKTAIGIVGAGQAVEIVRPNSLDDNWRVNNH